VAAIQLLAPGQGKTRHRTGEINGVPVLGVHPVARGYDTFLLPTLHALVTVRGRLFDKIEGTLTRSPLSVVLAPGRQLLPQRFWLRYDFLGISFAAPSYWNLDRNGHWGCPYSMPSETVTLIPVYNSHRPRCAAILPTAGMIGPHPGVIVSVGPSRGPDSAAFAHCKVLHGLRACYQPSHDGSLDVAVFVPGRPRATLVEIGLSGDGTTARTIFQSIGRG